MTYWQATYDFEQTQAEIFFIRQANNGNWSLNVGYAPEWNATLQGHILEIGVEMLPNAIIRKIEFEIQVQDLGGGGQLDWGIFRNRVLDSEGGTYDPSSTPIITDIHTTTPDVIFPSANIDREYLEQTSLNTFSILCLTENVSEFPVNPYTIVGARLLGEGLPPTDLTRRAAVVQVFEAPVRDWQAPG
jgi:hypothetical protein